jgi:hypothetical protein
MLAQTLDVGAAGAAGIVGLVFTVIVGPIIGLLIWQVRQLISVTIPGLQHSYHESLTLVVTTYRADQAEYRAEAKEELKAFRAELEAQRQTMRAEGEAHRVALSTFTREIVHEIRANRHLTRAILDRGCANMIPEEEEKKS